MTINYIIVEVDEAYLNEIEGITVNNTIESVAHINREAIVVDAPSFTILKKGDRVLMHHNILRLRNGIRGKKVRSNYHLEGNKYFVPLTEVFMYQRDSDWNAIRPFTFVKPIPKEDKKIGGFIVNATETNSHKGMKKLRGIMKYPNDDLADKGIKAGDEVVFSEWSEYEFNVNGEILYKMSSKDILASI